MRSNEGHDLAVDRESVEAQYIGAHARSERSSRLLGLRLGISLCFILSGAASVSYQMIWLRQAMTYFGVITPIISAVLSVFMLGLAAGTLIAGKLTTRISQSYSLKLYAIVEFLIGACSLVIPGLFKAGYGMLLRTGPEHSGIYLLFSSVLIALILLPICTLIGSTFPLLMHYLKSHRQFARNFGFLYFANLLGALIGCLFPVVAIELYGFRYSAKATAAMNVSAALLASVIFYQSKQNAAAVPPLLAAPAGNSLPPQRLLVLFLFGFVTLGSEVIWIRAFTPFVGPTVYAFALILAIYLISSAMGTGYYLRSPKVNTSRQYSILLLLPLSAVTVFLINSHAFFAAGVGGLVVLCFCLGFLTPKLVDDTCGNDARKTSIAYTYNFIGCVAGPLISTYLLFPRLGIKGSLAIYALLLFLISYFMLGRSKVGKWVMVSLFAVIIGPVISVNNMEDYIIRNGKLERDYVGYIGAVGKGMNRALLVNGISMTGLMSTTKLMAHLPLLHHPQAKSALVICFGMGTTVRSMTAWPLDKITVVELSEGVPKLFPYFHDDAGRVLADPRVKIVVDDGRRYLNRSHEQYDVIAIDPPPPITSSGSGLLYTTEFLAIAKQRLAPGGILGHWIYPWVRASEKDTVVINATIRAIKKTFRYIKIYDSLQPGLGIHVLASDYPLPALDENEFVDRLPLKAAADLEEWEKGRTLLELAGLSLHEIPERNVLLPELNGVYMSDDRLYNEFYLLRNMRWFSPSHMGSR